MKSFFSRLDQFFRLEVWATGFKGHKAKDPWYKTLYKVLFMAVQGFRVDRCSLNASALTYYSLLAIVPLLALAFGIAKGFHLDDTIEKELMDRFEQYRVVMEEAVSFAKRVLESTQGGVIAGVGVLILLWAIIKVLDHIEDVFNRIWLVKKGRSFGRKFTDYITIVIICPSLVLASNTTAVMMITEVEKALYPVIGSFADWLSVLIALVPYIATTTLLTFLYMFIPSVKVKFRTGLIAGLMTAVSYHLVQFFYLYFQIGIARYGAIYGSFAAFPLFLIWIQISWMIILFGAELSYSIQNLGIYGLKQMKRKITIGDTRILTLAIMHVLVKNFHDRNPPLNYREISQKLEIPHQVSAQLLDTLVNCHLAAITEDGKKGYQPAIETANLKIVDVMAAIEKKETETLEIHKNEELRKIELKLDEFDAILEQSPQNCLLKDV